MTENTLKAGTLFSPELVIELMSKVKGKSVLASLTTQKPIPFNGTEQFIFNLEGNAYIVGEGEAKKAGKSTLEPVVIKPMKFVYQARYSDEFKYAADEKRLQYLKHFTDGFAKIIARSFDIAALHGVEPGSMTDGSFKAKNSFDGQIIGNVSDYAEANIDENIEAAVQQVILKGAEINGMAISPVAGAAMAKKVDTSGRPLYPEFKFGQIPATFGNMKTASAQNLVLADGSHTADKDYVIVGDFDNMFQWGYAENIPLEIIEYGDPDGTGRDLKQYNEVCLRAEAFIGWGILDADSFARVRTAHVG